MQGLEGSLPFSQLRPVKASVSFADHKIQTIGPLCRTMQGKRADFFVSIRHAKFPAPYLRRVRSRAYIRFITSVDLFYRERKRRLLAFFGYRFDYEAFFCVDLDGGKRDFRMLKRPLVDLLSVCARRAPFLLFGLAI